MAFNLVQAGTSLYSLNPSGGPSSALTMPSGVVLSALLRPRFARFQKYVVMVNSPSRPISIDTAGVVRVLTPMAPGSAPVLTGAAGGALSGTFQAKATFITLDSLGNLISESDFSPTSNVITIASQFLRAANLPNPTDQVNAMRLYRTTSNGVVYFPWIDINASVIFGATGGLVIATALQDDTSDAGLGLIAAGSLGAAPDLTLIAEWAGRLWGVGRVDGDTLRYTEAGEMYAWGGLNALPIPHVGSDRFGITALAPRQNVLGVGRRNTLQSVAGSTIADFRPIAVSENCGIVSQESVVTFMDTVYFLWLDGVYRWDDNGLACISDLGGVRSWFTTDNYFARGMFSNAFAVFDPIALTYRLFLCTPGQTQTNRWVEFNLRTNKWYGPHKTDAFTPSCGLTMRGANDQPYPMVGSLEGYVSQDVLARTDWGITPINLDVKMCAHVCSDPDTFKYFGDFSIFTEPQKAGTLQIAATVGELEETSVVSMAHDLRISRERLDRLGEGTYAALRFQNAEVGQNVVIHGYSIPYHYTGKR